MTDKPINLNARCHLTNGDVVEISRMATDKGFDAGWACALDQVEDIGQNTDNPRLVLVAVELRKAMATLHARKSSTPGRARDGIEAQHGLNDTYPGDPYP